MLGLKFEQPVLVYENHGGTVKRADNSHCSEPAEGLRLEIVGHTCIRNPDNLDA